MKGVSLIVIFVSLGPYPVHPEQINHLMAGVGSIGITAIDLQDEIKKIRRAKLPIPRSKPITHVALDSLIEKAIIEYTAKEESIRATGARIDNEIKKEIEAKGLKNETELKRELRKYSITWEDYRQNMYQSIIRRQVAQQKIKLSPPSDKEIRDFYAKNIRQLGYKYYYRLISVPFRVGDTKDELRANQLIAKAKKIARGNFAKAARMYSRHPSRKKGGLMGWQKADEAALVNPRLPALLEQTPVGRISQEYPLGDSYFIVRVERKRRPTFDEMKVRIANILYAQKQQSGLSRWLAAERRRLSVKIFLKGYRQP